MTIEAAPAPLRSERLSGGVIAAASLVVLAIAAVLHVGIGAKFIQPAVVLDAFFRYDPAVFDHRVIWQLRLPRLLGALGVGAALGMAGAVIQAITRNPLAGPGILGMNAGAALAVVAIMTLTGVGIGATTPWVAAIGAIAVFAIVMAISSAGRAGPTPFKVTLAGVAVTACASAITSAILVFDEAKLDNIRLWLAGDLASVRMAALGYAAIPMALGAAAALIVSTQLNALALGDQAAKALGVPVRRTRFLALGCTALLAGASVAMVGPVGFIGLVVPHIVKLFVANENRLIIPLSGVVGALALVLADIAARTLLAPQEMATGIVTAAIGAPVFILLVRARL